MALSSARVSSSSRMHHGVTRSCGTRCCRPLPAAFTRGHGRLMFAWPVSAVWRPPPRSTAAAASLNCAVEDGCTDEGAVTVRDDLDSLLRILPARLRSLLGSHAKRGELVEVILDLGRSPEIRGANGYREVLSAEETTAAELEAAASAVGSFGGDNRAGIEGEQRIASAPVPECGWVCGFASAARRLSFHFHFWPDHSPCFQGRCTASLPSGTGVAQS